MLLRVLGTLALDLPGRSAAGAVAQRRPLTLLAVLAVAGERGVPRERLQTLLWPESDAERARGALNQTVYALRRDTGVRDLVDGGPVLTLSAAALDCDLWTFERAAARGDVDAAVAAYAGPFLDGVLLPRAAEFERWAEGERARIAGRLARLLAEGTAAAAAAGDHGRAVVLAQRRVEVDPLDGAATVAWMRALAAAGERAEALRVAARHAVRLRTELDAEPAAEVVAYVAVLERAVPPAGGARRDAPSGASDPLFLVVPNAPNVSELPNDPGAPAEARPRSGELSNVAPTPTPTLAGAPRRMPRRLGGLAAALLVGAFVLAAGAWAWRLGGTTGSPGSEAARPGALDPRNIAVLYFDDHSPGRTLGFLADGLTEELIEQIAHVKALRVVSRNGVKAFRDHPVAFDSLARALGVGSVVEGSVQRSAGRLRVTVQLIDAATGMHLDSETFERPEAELFALQDDLTRQVSAFLRRRLGEEVLGREVRAETRSARALGLLLRAERERKDAAAVGRYPQAADRAGAVAALARADTLLAEAERADPRWGRPPVLRGRVLLQRALLDSGAVAASWVRGALDAANRALALDPEDAAALELRGAAGWRVVRLYNDAHYDSAVVARAEADLRRAVVRDSLRASAWATLSTVQRWRGAAAEAERSARRALAVDAYLEQASEVLYGLYAGAYKLGQVDSARAWCARGRVALPKEFAFVDCALTLMRVDVATRGPAAADPARAWAILRTVDRLDPAPAARLSGRPYHPTFRRMTVAGVLAVAGQRDSARAMLARARAEVAGDPTMRVDFLNDEAFVLLALGDRARGTAALRAFLAARPERRRAALHDPTLLGFGLDTAALGAPPGSTGVR